MANHPNRSTAKRLSKLLRVEHRGIEVPRSLNDLDCLAMLRAGLIIEVDDTATVPDRRYEATDYARDLIWGRID